MKWFVVVGRIEGQLEDSLYILQGDSPENVQDSFRFCIRQDAEMSGNDTREVYINHVVECPGVDAPQHVMCNVAP